MGLWLIYHLMGILAIWLVCLASQTTSICCRPTHISFDLSPEAEGESCGSFGGSENENGTCSAAICNDGNPVKGSVCSLGSCDSRGCRCKRRCIKMHHDPIFSFNEKYGFYNFLYVLPRTDGDQ